MKGLGTDDESLLRVVISRCEVDMVQIKEAFQRDYKQTLGQFIAVSYYIIKHFYTACKYLCLSCHNDILKKQSDRVHLTSLSETSNFFSMRFLQYNSLVIRCKSHNLYLLLWRCTPPPSSGVCHTQ